MRRVPSGSAPEYGLVAQGELIRAAASVFDRATVWTRRDSGRAGVRCGAMNIRSWWAPVGARPKCGARGVPWR